MHFFKNLRRKISNLASSHRTTLSENHKSHPEESGNKRSLFSFSGAVVSDVGCIRSNNEDNYVLGTYMNVDSADRSEVSFISVDTMENWELAGVFDGMGGGEVGELASRDTASFFLQAFSHLDSSYTKTDIDVILRRTFLDANNRVIDLQKEYNIFGTTGTVFCTNNTEFKVYHLGDSRAYLFRENELFQLTKDQTLAQMKMDVGMYKEDDPAAEADKHKLTEYIGRDWTRENLKPVESHWVPIQLGDIILLCSDGLYDMCTSEEIRAVLQSEDTIEEKTAKLVEKARTNGGEDNITCILLCFM